MSCLSYPGRPECITLAGRLGLSDSSLENQSSLRDLISSDDTFLSMIEAIHYLNFPGF